MAQPEQSSNGDNSPNINGNGNLVATIVAPLPLKLSNEVQMMAEIIKAISTCAETALQEEVIDRDTDKDLVIKLKQRFSTSESRIRERYFELFQIYGASYEAAWEAVDLRGVTIDEIAYYLRKESNRILTTCPEPIEAMERLVGFLEAQFERGTISFSRAAIEYFVYTQFVRCNVFPNPKEI